MFRYLLILLLVYLVYRLIRFLLVIRKAARKIKEDLTPEEPSKARNDKLIGKDEGEYVDYEEMKP
ncbi:MAG: hypothetical protein R6V75_06385 [Bacteroidales bacterium]